MDTSTTLLAAARTARAAASQPSPGARARRSAAAGTAASHFPVSLHVPFLGGRRAGVKIGSGCPPTPVRFWSLRPSSQSGAGALTLTGRALCLEHAVQTFGSRPRPPGSPGIWPMVTARRQSGDAAAAGDPRRGTRAAGGAGRGDRRGQGQRHGLHAGAARVRADKARHQGVEVPATTNAIIELAGHLAGL